MKKASKYHYLEAFRLSTGAIIGFDQSAQLVDFQRFTIHENPLRTPICTPGLPWIPQNQLVTLSATAIENL
jgi:hypothetical protein